MCHLQPAFHSQKPPQSYPFSDEANRRFFLFSRTRLRRRHILMKTNLSILKSRFILISFTILSGNKCNYISPYCERIKTRNLILTDAAAEIKNKGIPRQVEMALGVPCRLRPRIFFTFGTTRVVGRQPNAPAAFTPGKIHGTHFQRLRRPRNGFVGRNHGKKSQVTPPGIDPGTVRLVAQRLNY